MSVVKKVPAFRIIDGKKVHVLCTDAANADPIRAARLQVSADAGDAEAERELEKLLSTPMYEIVEEDEE